MAKRWVAISDIWKLDLNKDKGYSWWHISPWGIPMFISSNIMQPKISNGALSILTINEHQE